MPHPDRIFHYTSVETLALILRARKLRFSRLDQVDDAREAPTVQGIAFSKYLFVSCWSAEPVESIPQWHLYTEKMTGVRIELPAYPFMDKRLTPPSTWIDVQSQGSIRGPLSWEEIYGPTYMILPMFLNRDHFAGAVEYVDDVQQRYEGAVSIKVEPNMQAQISLGNPPELARYKTKHWQFQSEYRFALFAIPSLPLPPEGPGSPSFYNAMPAHAMRCLQTGQDPGVQYVDVDIRPSALSEMVVTTGPHCSPGAKLCVESLIKQYAPLARVQPSELEGWVRRRGAA